MAQLLEFAAFIRLRVALPDAYRPYRVPLGTVGCMFLLLPGIMIITLLMIIMPLYAGEYASVAATFSAVGVGCGVYCVLELARARGWATFACSPPKDVDDIFAFAMTPVMRSAPPERHGSGSSPFFLSPSRDAADEAFRDLLRLPEAAETAENGTPPGSSPKPGLQSSCKVK